MEAADPTCALTGTDTPAGFEDRVLTPAIGQDITCVFSNRDLPGPPVPTPTGPGGPHIPVTGTDVRWLMAAGGLAVAAGLILPLVGIRRRDT